MPAAGGGGDEGGFGVDRGLEWVVQGQQQGGVASGHKHTLLQETGIHSHAASTESGVRWDEIPFPLFLPPIAVCPPASLWCGPLLSGLFWCIPLPSLNGRVAIAAEYGSHGG